MAKITLENMEFHAFHGCLDHEKALGNTFLVTVTIETDTSLAGQTDQLDHTLNYQWVYDVVNEQMQIPSQLIEHVAQRILDGIWNKFEMLSSLNVQLSKLNPPLGGKVNKVSIELSKNRTK